MTTSLGDFGGGVNRHRRRRLSGGLAARRGPRANPWPRRSRSIRTTSAASSRATAGPEAGVWVIAETTDLPTKFVRIVVTDDQGRYLIPDLPKATYRVWVRGYGLVDSPKVKAAPGSALNLTAVTAPNARAAAQYYPAGYWFSLMQRAGEERVPRHRRRQRHLPGHQAARPSGCAT